MKKRLRPGSLCYHELLHATGIIMELFDVQICEHPSRKVTKKIDKKIERIFDDLFDLYQELGMLCVMRRDR